MTGFSTAEIDGWVFEWTCALCERELTIGVTNKENDHVSELDTPLLSITHCPGCTRQQDADKIKKRTIYHDDLARVQGAVRDGKKARAVKELRSIRVARGYDRSGLKECTEDVKEMISEYKQYTQEKAS